MRKYLFWLIPAVLVAVILSTFLRSNHRRREAERPRSYTPPPPAPTPRPKTVYVPILVYHLVRPARKTDPPSVRKYNVVPELFAEELKYLKEHGYTTITFDRLAACLRRGAPLPAQPVIICFDDGWENQYRYALPLLRQYRFVATFFIYPLAIGKKNYLSWDQVNEIAAAGMPIGSHSLTHPYLDRMTDEKKLRAEIFTSKRLLEEKTGRPVTAFAYPFGRYNPQVRALVKAAGYTTARTIRWGAYHTEADLLTLRAYLVPNDFTGFLTVLKFRSPAPGR